MVMYKCQGAIQFNMFQHQNKFMSVITELYLGLCVAQPTAAI